MPVTPSVGRPSRKLDRMRFRGGGVWPIFPQREPLRKRVSKGVGHEKRAVLLAIVGACALVGAARARGRVPHGRGRRRNCGSLRRSPRGARRDRRLHRRPSPQEGTGEKAQEQAIKPARRRLQRRPPRARRPNKAAPRFASARSRPPLTSSRTSGRPRRRAPARYSRGR